LGASDSPHPDIAKPATVKVMAKTAVSLRMTLFSFAKIVRGDDTSHGAPSDFTAF
jgi:hypothetical protein